MPTAANKVVAGTMSMRGFQATSNLFAGAILSTTEKAMVDIFVSSSLKIFLISFAAPIFNYGLGEGLNWVKNQI